jgi:[acyl-carrier-protein] S-malonyltransferase
MSKRFAMVFPGQGSQSVGMLADLAASSPVVRETFDQASEALGLDLWQLTQHGPDQQLNLTENSQPAMLTAGVAVWRAWQDADGPLPSLMAGHSLGEYTALVCAAAVDFTDAVRLVAARGRFMQQAVPAGSGAMAAILGLDDEQVHQVCREAAGDQVVEAVNFNAPGQVVIAGQAAAVERAGELARAAGARRVVALAVSVPSHCALMKPAAERLAERLADTRIEPPVVPVIHNVNAGPAVEPDRIRELLAAQLYRPVRWVETVERMKSEGIDVLLEGGPGKVLTGLVRRIDKSMSGLAIFDAAGIQTAKEGLA